jgi:hypothetical protein
MEEQPKERTGTPGNAFGIAATSQSCHLTHHPIEAQADGKPAAAQPAPEANLSACFQASITQKKESDITLKE